MIKKRDAADPELCQSNQHWRTAILCTPGHIFGQFGGTPSLFPPERAEIRDLVGECTTDT